MELPHAITRTAALLCTASVVGGCSVFSYFTPAGPRPQSSPPHPAENPPTDEEARAIWKSALDAGGRRIVVSIQDRRLWLLEGEDTVISAPVAVGTGDIFVWDGKEYVFRTPRGRREVLAKAHDPLWVPPDWHYFELAADRGLEPVQLERGDRIVLSDSTIITVRGDQVGRINRFGNFWPFTPGTEIIFDDTIFIPPFGTAQRRIPEVLGTRKLELGDGYLIHGTNEEDSIGEAVSHGCVRMYNEDVEKLFGLVDVGTAVFIY